VETEDNPTAIVNCVNNRKARSGLSNDVAKLSGKCRSLVQDRLPHHGPHRLRDLVVTELEVFLHFNVLDMPQALSAECRIGKKERKFNEGQTGFRKDVERVSQ